MPIRDPDDAGLRVQSNLGIDLNVDVISGLVAFDVLDLGIIKFSTFVIDLLSIICDRFCLSVQRCCL